MEAKYSGDGLEIQGEGKFSQIISKFKGKTKSFLDEMFGSSNAGGSGNRNSLLKKGKGFFSRLFANGGEKDEKKKKDVDDGSSGLFNRVSGLFTKFSDSLELNKEYVSEMMDKGKERMKAMFDGFSSKRGGRESTSNFFDSIMNAGTTLFSSVSEQFTKKSNLFREFIHAKKQDKGSGKKLSFSERLKMMYGNLFVKVHDITKGRRQRESMEDTFEGAVNGRRSKRKLFRGNGEEGSRASLFSNMSKWFSTDKEPKSGGSTSKFSMPTIFNKLFQPKDNTLQVTVAGGQLDGIREVVKVVKHVGDRNSAAEQHEDFKAKQEEKRLAHKQNIEAIREKSRSRRNLMNGGNGTGEGGQGGGGMLSGLIGNVASEILGETIGNAIGNRGGRGRDGDESGDGSNGRRRSRRNRGANGGGRGRGGFLRRAGGGALRGAKGLGKGLKGIGKGLWSGAKGLGKGAKGLGKLALKGAKLIPGVGWVLGAGMGAYSGIKGAMDANEVLGSEESTLGMKLAGATGGIADSLSFGLINGESATKNLYSMFGGKVPEEAESKPRVGSFRDGGVIDYTGSANVHGSKDNPEMVLNAKQSTALFSWVKDLSTKREEEAKDRKKDEALGERAKNPINKIAYWTENLGKFFSKGLGATLFGGILGAIGGLGGKVTGWIGKAVDGFKGFFSNIFGGGKDESSGGGGGSDTINSGATGSTNEQTIWNFFKANGFSDQATAGIIGNLKQESGLDPTKKQYGGGPGRGLLQWEVGGRWDNLVSWAKKSGKSEWDMQTQLEYIMLEMQGKDKDGYSGQLLNKNYGGVAGFKGMTNVNDAMMAFEKSMERAGKPNYDNRKAYAEQAYARNKGTGGDSIPMGSGSGVAGKIIEEARKWMGKLTYSMSGPRNPERGSADCSSFVNYVFKKVTGMNLGSYTEAQLLNTSGTNIPISDLVAGDVIFFKNTYNSGYTNGVSHVGIVSGNGNMVHLSSNGKNCNEESYQSGYWKSHQLSGKRFIKGNTGAVADGGGSSSGGSSSSSSNNFMNMAGQSHSDFFQDVWNTRTNSGSSSTANGTGGDSKFSGDNPTEFDTGQKSSFTSKTLSSLSPLDVFKNFFGDTSTVSRSLMNTNNVNNASSVTNKTLNQMERATTDQTDSINAMKRALQEGNTSQQNLLETMISLLTDIRDKDNSTNVIATSGGGSRLFASNQSASQEFALMNQGY